MAERQVADRDLVRTETERLDDRLRGPHEVRVRDHDGLRIARRARGVDERADVVRLLGRDACVELALGSLVAELEELVPAEHTEATSLALRRTSEHLDDDLEVRHVLLLGDELVDLLRRVGERDLGLAVVRDVPHLLRRVRRVDARGDRAGEDRADVRDQPLGAVVADDCDTRAGLHPEADERTPDATRVTQVCAPCRRAPATVTLHAKRRPVSIALRRLPQDLVNHGRHGRKV